jgi:ABC-type uncharacterized transport system involved in gliding motility auxiliary subunit
MSTRSKILFLISLLLIGATILIKVIIGMWVNLNSILAALAGVSFVLAVASDFRLYRDFFTMRTTKHGLNMGALILLVLTLIVCVNYLANKHNFTWDLTQEKLNSLSDQSVSILKGLKDDVEFKVFFRGPQATEDKQRVRAVLDNYQDYSGRIHVRYINAYVENQLALEYMKDMPERDAQPVLVYLDRGSRRIRVDAPYDEAAITSALIKATREGEAKIYFLQGHGEKTPVGTDDTGLKELAKSLEEGSFKVDTLNLLDKKEIPSDASVLAIVGPVVPYLDTELKWLRDYALKGGKLLIALDPGTKQNLANLTKTLGVQYQNNYVFTQSSMIQGGGPATILGRSFDQASDITKSFPSGGVFGVFPLTSEVDPAADKSKNIQVDELVKTDAFSFTVVDPTKPLTARPELKAVTIAVESHGKLEDKPDAKSFSAVIFGDSDFMSNRAIMLGVNRDLILNAIAQLSDQKDLISIRPKIPKGSIVTLTSYQRLTFIILGLSLPVILLILSGVMWFRRRGA